MILLRIRCPQCYGKGKVVSINQLYAFKNKRERTWERCPSCHECRTIHLVLMEPSEEEIEAGLASGGKPLAPKWWHSAVKARASREDRQIWHWHAYPMDPEAL